MEPKMSKVKCSYCSVEMDCPENMLGAPKHACFDCFQKIGKEIQVPKDELEKIHVDLPLNRPEVFQKFMNSMIARAFADYWETEKKNLKDRSKKELAEQTFFEGAKFMFAFMNQMSAEQAAHEQHGESGHDHSAHGHEHKYEHKHDSK